MNDFYGYPVYHLSNKFIELDCLSTAGPRIVRLSYKDSSNLLAEVPEFSLPTPYGEYRFFGGHRLWQAPESMPETYIPDTKGLDISELTAGVLLKGKPQTDSGIHKQIEIRIAQDQPKITLKHTLVNENPNTIELSPWTITMLHLGGTAILPCQAKGDQNEKLRPNRHFSLWPYSKVDFECFHLEDEYILYSPKPDAPAFKMGTFNLQGWIAYWWHGILFRKIFSVNPDLPYPDYGCNTEIYSDNRFIELEALGPLVKLPPRESVCFTETWELYDSLHQGFIPQKLAALISTQSP